MSSFFNHDKYNGLEGLSNYYADPTDAYANNSQIFISFYSLIAGSSIGSINFKAYVTSYSDTFSSDWGEEMVFGRNDPIYAFKGTTRSIGLGFQVVAGSLYEAIANLERVQDLAKCLYPAYKRRHAYSTNLTKPPLMKLKFANLISDHSRAGGSRFNTTRGGSAEAKTGGLVGVIKSLNITPNFDSGVYDGPGKATVYPKLIEVTIEFGVIHQSSLGFGSQSGNPKIARFPYGVRASEAQMASPAASVSAAADEDTETAVDNAPTVDDQASAPPETKPAIEDPDATQADIDEETADATQTENAIAGGTGDTEIEQIVEEDRQTYSGTISYGKVVREEGETDEEYAVRSAAVLAASEKLKSARKAAHAKALLHAGGARDQAAGHGRQSEGDF